MTTTYPLLKFVHLLGVVVFVGNILITGWWKTMADRTRNPVIIAFAQRQVTVTDWLFTAGGVFLVLIGGLGNALLHDMDFLEVNWLAWGAWLFVGSGVIWGLVLIPVQIAQERMARNFSPETAIPEVYWKLGRTWIVFGTIATLLPVVSMYFMVLKPA